MMRRIGFYACIALLPLSLRAEADSVRSVVLNKTEKFALNNIPIPVSESGNAVAKKSVPKAFALSLIFPGAGQFYAQKGNESIIKGSLMGGLDITSWIVYFHSRSQGSRYVRKFERYANINWDIDKYLVCLETTCEYDAGYLGRKITGSPSFLNPGIDREKLRIAENLFASKTGVATHHIFETGKQQYYEMIYKYPEQFALGWSDAGPGADPLYPRFTGSPTGYSRKTLTANMNYYRGMRNKSNEYYDTAQFMAGIMFANRFLSGLDAAWTAKRKNNALRQTIGLRIYPLMYNQKIIYSPSLEYNF